MKKLLLLTFYVLFLGELHAQKFEFSVQANSGLFHYSGNGATGTTFINQGGPTIQNYTNNPYGNKNGFSYGAGFSANFVNKSGFMAGLGLTYEILRSGVNVTSVNPYYGNIYPWYDLTYTTISTSGSTILKNESLNFNPYIGYRLNVKKIRIDIMPGLDLVANVNSVEKGKATDGNANVYQTNYKLSNEPMDVRLRFGIAAGFNKFSLTASYAHGLKNLDNKTMGAVTESLQSDLIRFGIAYKLW